MKKLYIVLAMICAGNMSVFGQLKPKIAISYELSPSYAFVQSQTITTFPMPGVINTTTGDVVINYKEPPIMIKSGLEYQYKRASIYFDNTVYCKMAGNPLPGNFSPQQIRFDVGLKYQIAKHIQFTYEHMCTHSVCVQSTEMPTTRMNGSYDKFCISYGY